MLTKMSINDLQFLSIVAEQVLYIDNIIIKNTNNANNSYTRKRYRPSNDSKPKHFIRQTKKSNSTQDLVNKLNNSKQVGSWDRLLNL